MQDLAAIIPVDGHPLTPRDIARNRVAGNRLTTPGNGSHQVANSLDGDVTGAFRLLLALPVGRARDQVFGLGSNLLCPQAVDGVDYLADCQVAITNCNKQIFHRGQAETLDHRLEVAQKQADPLCLTFNRLFTGSQIFFPAFLLEPLPDLGSPSRAMDITQTGTEPIAAGPGLLRCQDFYPVSGFHNMGQGHDAAVDLGPAATMPNLGMHLIGKIEYGGAGRQVHDLAARGQDVYPVFAGGGLETVQQALIVQALVAGIQQLAHDGNLVIECRVSRAALLVAPVGCDTQFCMLVHLLCADLYLNCPPVPVGNGRVQ